FRGWAACPAVIVTFRWPHQVPARDRRCAGLERRWTARRSAHRAGARGAEPGPIHPGETRRLRRSLT
ncbi:MAG: hypothetical protein ACRDRO_17000, partial [Pseudonocardiaceae bacterium]